MTNDTDDTNDALEGDLGRAARVLDANAQAMGRKARGVPKRLSNDQREALRTRMRSINARKREARLAQIRVEDAA
jgi:hypothetical protein